MIKKIIYIFFLSFLILCQNQRALFSDETQTFLAGAAKENITPVVEPFTDLNGNGRWDPVWLAGYQNGRFAQGVHDDLWARAWVVTLDKTTVLFVSLDLIGYLFDEVAFLKEEISSRWGMAPGNIFIASTHTHGGPDTIGLWGEGGSGKNPEYMISLRKKILKCVENAVKSRRPAKIAFARNHFGNPIYDARPPRVINDLLLSLRAVDDQNHTIATVVNYAMHAEVLDGRNRLVTADYPGVLREDLEKHFGGVSLFFAGDIGGMQTPKVLFHTFFTCRRVGHFLSRRVISSLEKSEPASVNRLEVRSKKVLFPIENPRFLGAIQNGLFGETDRLVERENDKIFLPSDVALIRLGPAQFGTIPGEAFPEVGRRIRDRLRTDYPFLLGLCNNEIGYIVPEEEWDEHGYEETMSLGPKTSELLLNFFQSVLE
ncbi:MAG: neutral/alkaline non-lysosomal ceramidase N-terminal domain-containing protein [Elusimicrobia bacterium]|nr:neutral/alkaline non-lysosomal ceramidase N-terminal domain-containing protein [Elusimicrobiota bacterium]